MQEPNSTNLKYIDHSLLPIVKPQSIYKWDSVQVLDKLKILTLEQDVLNVCELTAGWDNKLNLQLQYIWISRPRTSLSNQTHCKMSCLLGFIPHHKISKFNRMFHRQKIGEAKGSECSPKIRDKTLFRYAKIYRKIWAVRQNIDCLCSPT